MRKKYARACIRRVSTVEKRENATNVGHRNRGLPHLTSRAIKGQKSSKSALGCDRGEDMRLSTYEAGRYALNGKDICG